MRRFHPAILSSNKLTKPAVLRAAWLAALLFGVVACGGSEVTEDTSVNPLTFAAALNAERSSSVTVDLSGSQALPPVDTRETARASFILDTQTLQLFAVLNTSLSDYISVDIHEGEVGESGAVVASLYQLTDGSFSLPAGTFLSDDQSRMFLDGGLYVDVHTDEVEIRAQITADSIEPVVGATLSELQAHVFTPICSGCHSGGGISLPSVMDFTSAQASYNSLVGVNSMGVGDLLRVDPGSPESSFLIHKIEGSQIVGGRMPLRGTRLSDQLVQSFRQWIALGARK